MNTTNIKSKYEVMKKKMEKAFGDFKQLGNGYFFGDLYVDCDENFENGTEVEVKGHHHTKDEIDDFDHTHAKSEITDFAHTHSPADLTGLSETGGTELYKIYTAQTSNYNTAAGGTEAGKTVTDTRNGYRAVGIIGYSIEGTNKSFVNIYEQRVSSRGDGTMTITFSIRNTGTSKLTNVYINFYVLWMKIG